VVALILFLAATVLLPSVGRAAEQPLHGGKTARFVALQATRHALIEFAGDSALATLGDPRCPSVSRLRLSTAVAAFTQIELPCANWRAISGGYIYIDPMGAAGGVHAILLVNGRMLVRLGGKHYAPVGGPIPFAEVTLAVGGNSACGRFANFKLNTAGRVTAAPGSGDCHPRPNFIIINLDDSRFDGVDRMPNMLARLAGEGVTFTNSFVVDSLCAPSRASMLSGLDPRHNGVQSLGGEIGGAHIFRETGADHETVAVWLQTQGYRTGLFGKYINGYGPTEQHQGPNGTFYVPPGWTRWRGMVSTEHYGGVLGPTYMLVDEHGAVTTYDNHTTDEQYSTDLLAGEVRTFVADTVSAGRNFFVYYTPYASHSDTPDLEPHPAQRHYGTFLFRIPLWRPASWNEPDVSDKPLWLRTAPQTGPLPAAVNDAIRALAYETLLAVDEQLGMFLDQLAALGVDNDTVIVFTSDNGVTWGEHRLFGQGKQCPYEECVRVPMVVRYPRGITVPAEQDAPVLNIDVAPTVVAMSGVTAPAMDGVSFAGWIGGPLPLRQRDDFVIENWRGGYNDSVSYTAQPSDGDQIRVLYGNKRANPRAAALFEFDSGGGVTPGAIAVPIGATADATFSNLGDAIAAAVPFTSKLQNLQQHSLTTVDMTPDHTGVYFLVERDQGGVIQHIYPLPDYFGVRDVTNHFTYVEYETNEAELYDLTADPGQLQNVAGQPAYAAQQLRLAQRLQTLLTDSSGP
jgi:arylsulfatase A-like enzyme